FPFYDPACERSANAKARHLMPYRANRIIFAGDGHSDLDAALAAGSRSASSTVSRNASIELVREGAFREHDVGRQRGVEIRVAVAREDDPVGAVGHQVARLGVRRALAGRVVKPEGRDQPVVRQEAEVVREYRDAVDSVAAQDMPYERHEAVADDVDADLPQLRPFDD